MADLSQIKKHMEIVGADGIHVGTVDKVKGDRIKMTRKDSGSHNHHHYLSGGLVAAIDGDRVRLTANSDAAVLLEEEKGGGAIWDSGRTWPKVLIGAAAVGAAAAAGAFVYSRRKGSATRDGGESEIDVVFEADSETAPAQTATPVAAV